MQKIMARNPKKWVKNEIEPTNPKIVLTRYGRNVAKMQIANTIKMAALIITSAEYLRRLEQVDVRQSPSSMLPHRALSTAVTTNNIMTSANPYGIISRTIGIIP